MNLNNERNKKELIPLIIYLFISFILISLSTVKIFAPIYFISDKVTGSIRASWYNSGTQLNNYFGFFFNAQKFIAEDKNLKEKVAQLESLQAKNATLQDENNTLRAQLGVSQEIKTKMVMALITSEDTTLDSITINKGSNEGVAVNNVAIYKNILCGKVIDVSNESAKILLVASINSNIPVKVEGSSVDGILAGSLQYGLIMNDILPDETVSIGSTIVTSGLGGIFPSGLLIGNVSSVQSVSSQPFKNAVIKSALDLTTIDYVFIIK